MPWSVLGGNARAVGVFFGFAITAGTRLVDLAVHFVERHARLRLQLVEVSEQARAGGALGDDVVGPATLGVRRLEGECSASARSRGKT